MTAPAEPAELRHAMLRSPRAHSSFARVVRLAARSIAILALLALAASPPASFGMDAPAQAAPAAQGSGEVEGDASPASGAEATAVDGASGTAPGSALGEGETVPASPDEVAAVAKTLNCPLCQGYSLQECPLEVCAQMRALIAQSLAEGKSPEAIRADFVAEYGPQVLNAPPAEGFYLSAWWTPVLVLLAGALWLAMRMRAGAAPGTAGAGGSRHSPDPTYTTRVEALLRDEEAP